jgi:CPA2 family monovalent cation:H+ antiporter-2
MRMSGRSIASALLVGITLGQIGEFSFILASLAVSLKLLPLAGQSLVLAGAIVSIAGNTLLFAALAPLTRWLSPAPAQTPGQQAAPEDALTQLPELPAGAADPLQQHIVIAGWGKVGRRVSEQLSAQGLNPVILEHDRELVKAARQQGLLAVAGDTSLASVLATIKLEQAATLAITFQDPAHTRSLVQLARSLNPGIAILMLAQDEEEADLLLKEELGSVFWAESELARSMTAHIALKREQPA